MAVGKPDDDNVTRLMVVAEMLTQATDELRRMAQDMNRRGTDGPTVEDQGKKCDE
jgi:hypothetical protein